MVRRGLLAVVVVAFVAALSTPGAVRAANPQGPFTVDTPADAPDSNPGDGICSAALDQANTCTLRAAIMEADAAPAPDDQGTPFTVTINVPANTYPLTLAGTGDDTSATGDLDFEATAPKTIALVGAGSGSTTIDATALGDRAIDVAPPALDVVISGVTIDGGSAQNVQSVDFGEGGAIRNGGQLRLDDVTIENSTAAGSGGAIANELDGSLTIGSGGVDISAATATNGGGGIYNVGSLDVAGPLTIADATTSSSGAGGGILNDGAATLKIEPGQSVEISATTPSEVASAESGGGVFNIGTLTVGGTLHVSDTSARAVEVGGDGGGIFNEGGGSVSVPSGGVVVLDSTGAAGNGGGIENNGSFDVAGSLLISSTAAGQGNGGAIDNVSPPESQAAATFTIHPAGSADRILIGGASASGNGGAIYNSGVFTADALAVLSASSSNGGGLMNDVGGQMTLTGSTLAGATAGANGGGVYNAGTFSGTNLTVTGNRTSEGSGSGIYDDNGLTLRFSTIAWNTGGAQLDTSNDVDASGVLVAANGGNANCNFDRGGTITTDGNLETNPASCGFQFQVDDAGLAVAPTTDPVPTLPLSAGSPAIDASPAPDGDCPATDARGVARPNTTSDPCDIGAYEFVGQALDAAVPDGGGTISTTNGAVGIDCPSLCHSRYQHDSTVTLAATPDPGQVFDSWSGACATVTDPTCDVFMDSDKSVGATFRPPDVTVTKTGSGSGTVTSSPNGIGCGSTCSAPANSFGDTSRVALTATPDGSSTFSGWSGCDSTDGDVCTVNLGGLDADRTVTATFTSNAPPPPSSFTLAVTKDGSGSGSVTSSPSGIDCGSTCSASFSSGTSVTLTASASGGSSFAGWTGDCATASGSTCTVAVDRARSVGATFAPPPAQFTLTVTKSGSGTVTSSPGGIDCGTTCSATYGDGTLVTLTASPAAGQSFAGWAGDCSGTGTCTVTVSAARSVAATFVAASTGGGAATTVSANVLTGADLSVTQSASSPAVQGSPVTFTIVVRNGGSDAASGVSVAETLASQLTLGSASTTTGSCSGSTCTIGSLASGASATVTITATPTATGLLTVLAVASQSGFDPIPSNDTASLTIDARLPETGAPPPTTPPASPNLPPPSPGFLVNAQPVTGLVLVDGVPLLAPDQIKVGAIVDTRGGSIQLITLNDTAVFHGGVFKIVQSTNPNGTTDLFLQPVVTTDVCAKTPAKKPKKRTTAAAARPKVLALLWGAGKGHFRTHGRYSSATVRGTIWLTADRCDGTFTYVQQGQVAVYDIPHRRTRILTAGHSYLSRPRH